MKNYMPFPKSTGDWIPLSIEDHLLKHSLQEEHEETTSINFTVKNKARDQFTLNEVSDLKGQGRRCLSLEKTQPNQICLLQWICCV